MTDPFFSFSQVNKVLNMYSVWLAEGTSDHWKKHQERVKDYLWLAEDGMKYQVRGVCIMLCVCGAVRVCVVCACSSQRSLSVPLTRAPLGLQWQPAVGHGLLRTGDPCNR